MKKSHDHTRRLAALGLVATLLISSLVMLAPSASARPVAESNELIGEYVTFHQDYTTRPSVPNNVYLMNRVNPSEVQNMSLSWIDGAIQLDSTVLDSGITKGYLNIVGLSSAAIVNRTIDVEFTRDIPSTKLSFYSMPGMYMVALSITADKELQIELFRQSSGDYQTIILGGDEWPQFADLTDSVRLRLGILHNGVDRTNTYYIDGKLVAVVPMYVDGITRKIHGTFTSEPQMYLTVQIHSASTLGTTASARIYSVTESVPEYSYVTPMPDPRMYGWGLDGPHPLDTIQNGIALVQQHGGTGTIFADVRYVNDDNLDYLRGLLDSGWELGIHYSKRLTDLSMEDAIATMNDEYLAIAEMFGRAPTIWCSHGNSDNETHAAYAWSALNMMWRNDYDLYGRMGLYGPLIETSWAQQHEILSAHGRTGVSYTHRTDLQATPDDENNIDWDHFKEWVINYSDNGVRMVGWYHYWTITQNTYHTEISDLMVDDGKSMSFALDNIGGKSRIFVAAPWTETVRDADGNEVPFEVVDGGIIMEVEPGEYQIYSMSGYRQEQVDRAISPLYAAIPVVIGLAVIGGLFTMLGGVFGRLKF